MSMHIKDHQGRCFFRWMDGILIWPASCFSCQLQNYICLLPTALYLLLWNYKMPLPRQHMPTSSRSRATTQHISSISAARCSTPNIAYTWGRHSTSKDNTTKAEASDPTAHHGSFWYTQRFRQFRLLFKNCLVCNRMAHLQYALDTWWIWMEPLTRTEVEQGTHLWIFIGGKAFGCKHKQLLCFFVFIWGVI